MHSEGRREGRRDDTAATDTAAATAANEVMITATDYEFESPAEIPAGLTNFKMVRNYAIVCFIPDAKGVPHLAHGMAKPLTVPPTRGRKWRSRMLISVMMTDYNFDFPGLILYPVDLAPGEYAIVCFLPDAKDGKPHFVHGMIQQIKGRITGRPQVTELCHLRPFYSALSPRGAGRNRTDE